MNPGRVPVTVRVVTTTAQASSTSAPHFGSYLRNVEGRRGRFITRDEETPGRMRDAHRAIDGPAVVKVQVTPDARLLRSPAIGSRPRWLAGPRVEDSQRPRVCHGSEAPSRSFQQRIDTSTRSGSDADSHGPDERVTDAHPLRSSAGPTNTTLARVPTASIVIAPPTPPMVGSFPSKSRSRAQGCSAGTIDGITSAPKTSGTACEGITCAWANQGGPARGQDE